jgi:hypothetical protein
MGRFAGEGSERDFGLFVWSGEREEAAAIQGAIQLDMLAKIFEFRVNTIGIGHSQILFECFDMLPASEPEGPIAKNSWIFRVEFVSAVVILSGGLVKGGAFGQPGQPPPSQGEIRVQFQGRSELTFGWLEITAAEENFSTELMGGSGRRRVG